MVVKRTINSATKRYIERMKPFDFGENTTTAFFVDSGLSYSGSSTATLSGLNHLNGQSITGLVNGATHPNRTVSAGAITLANNATTAAFGLGYNSQLKTLRIRKVDRLMAQAKASPSVFTL